MGVLVSVGTLVRMVAFGFVLGIIVGLYFGLGGATEPAPERPQVEAVNPAASP